jgi:predicted DNA binding protein
MLSASLSFDGFECMAIKMSDHSDYVEIANPTSRPHWVTIHNRGKQLLESMKWSEYCRSCPLRPLLDDPKIRTTRFLARRNKVYVDLIAKEKDYEKFLAGLNSTGVNFNVSKVHHFSNLRRPKGLTVNQLHTLRVALNEGYYDAPKRIDMRKLSQKLECSASTLCETLRRAEKKILQEYLGSMDAEVARRSNGILLEDGSVIPVAAVGEKLQHKSQTSSYENISLSKN